MNDLISRQAALIKSLESALLEHKDGSFILCSPEFVSMAVEILKELKTLQWTPCSEGLPEEFYVLCCDNHGEMLIANPFECDDSDTGFSAESEDCYMYNCVAWMPLPEPYKGDNNAKIH